MPGKHVRYCSRSAGFEGSKKGGLTAGCGSYPQRGKVAGRCPVIAGSFTPEIESRVENFSSSVAAIFEAWVKRGKSANGARI